MNVYLETNRKHWNELAALHANGERSSYDVEGFKTGGLTLRPLEIEEVGDVAGKTLLHLQCHFGMDTMSWARLGAKVTGVDFSEEAIDIARSLSEELGIAAQFVRSDIYQLRSFPAHEFDIVFTSYGVLAWLPDLAEWAKIAAGFLKPGGMFYIAEEHPFGVIFEDDGNGGLKIEYPYFDRRKPERYDDIGSYADPSAVLSNSTSYEWSHSLSEVVESLIAAGLTVEFLHEFPFCMYRRFPAMRQGDDGWWRLPKPYDDLPMLFSLRAKKP